MASKVVEADAGVHTLSMAVAVSVMFFSIFILPSYRCFPSGPYTACD
jgi:hypothetical protein